jgi:hypothetical protein
MKNYSSFHRIIILVFITGVYSGLFGGCKKKNGGDNNPTVSATSKICAQVTGVEAIYWDLMNGIPRTDLGKVPTVATTGGSYTHPSYPLLTFIYPTGYTPTTDPNTGWIGVNLIRNDNKSIWRYTSLFYSGTASPQAVLNGEVNSLKTFLGSTGTATTICSQQGTQPRAAGITTTSTSVYITFDTYSAVVQVSITEETGLGAEQITIATTSAPTAEFANEILNTYLPIDYQMLYKSDGELDSDGDGYPDSIDAYPYDPTRH